MQNKSYKAIIISISSDIGTAMAKRWVSRGWQVMGTYRTETSSIKDLSDSSIKLIQCNLLDDGSVKSACKILREMCYQWDILVISAGTQDPIGPFKKTDFDSWVASVNINFINQLRIVHELLPTRNRMNLLGPCVLFFAGGGTNNATINYSAYTISKIALIKMCELLDAEIPDTRFVIVGPGWVKTKIHDSTLRAGERAGANYQRTIDQLSSNESTPIDRILDCCDWLVDTPRELISGRNFSVVFDRCGTEELERRLAQEPNMYKLRRYGNDWLVKHGR